MTRSYDKFTPTKFRLDPRRGLPLRPIYYTVDQVATMLSLTVNKLTDSYLYRDGIEPGIYRARYLRAVNINPNEGRVDWRVPEGELIRWLTYHDLWVLPGDPSYQGNYTADLGKRFRKAIRSEDKTALRRVVESSASPPGEQEGWSE